MPTQWAKFAHAGNQYAYDAAALKKLWPRLHRGDCEPLPKSADALQAWRHYHAGNFQEAVTVGSAAGAPAKNAAIKAQAIYAHYLEKNDKTRLSLFEEAARWADERRAAFAFGHAVE